MTSTDTSNRQTSSDGTVPDSPADRPPDPSRPDPRAIAPRLPQRIAAADSPRPAKAPVQAPAASDWQGPFFRLAALNVLANWLVPLAGLIDIAFLGHLDDIRFLAGVALATVIFDYLYWTFGFLRMATTGTTAQALGRDDEDGVWRVALRNGVLALAIGTAIVLLQTPIRELGFTLLSATDPVKLAGRDYFNALIWGAPAALLNFVWVGWWMGRHQGGRVFVLSVLNNGTNVALNYAFVVQLGWGSAGAGGATAIAQGTMALAGLALFLREADWRQLRAIAPQVLDPKELKSAILLNGDILVRTFALISTFAAFTNLSSSLGTILLAANTLMLRTVTLSAYFIDGFAFATESIAGSLKGQGNVAELRRLLRLSGLVCFGLGLAFAAAFVTFPEPLFGLLTDRADVLAQVRAFVGWLVPVLAFGSVAYMLDGYFLGLTAGRALRRAGLVSALVGFAPLAAVAAWRSSPPLLWLALVGFMAGRALTLGACVPGTLRSEPGDSPVEPLRDRGESQERVAEA